MKIILLVVIIIMTCQLALAETFQIYRLKPHQREGLFLMINKERKTIKLDCSSFLQNITIETQDSAEWIYYLTIEECQNFFDFYKKPSLRKKCFTHDNTMPTYHYCNH
jgi:hypothetical protein